MSGDEYLYGTLSRDALDDLGDTEFLDYAKKHAFEDFEWALTERVGYLIDDKTALSKRAAKAEQDVFDLNNLINTLRVSVRNSRQSVKDWQEAEEKSTAENYKLLQDKYALVAEVNRRESVEAELRAQLAEATEELDYLRERARA